MLLADEAATELAGARLGEVAQVGDVIALSGALGAGKTCLSRGLIGALGFSGEVPSPTFGIVIPYTPPDVRIPLWHVDLYRIDAHEDFEELGLEEARTESVLIIEWPERMGSQLWPDSLCINLSAVGSGRRLTAKVPASWTSRWPFR